MDFQNRLIEWVLTPAAIEAGQGKRNESPVSGALCHSTCTASKAFGKIYNANKNAIAVIVKMPDYFESSIMQVLYTAYKDIKTKRRGRISVIVIA